MSTPTRDRRPVLLAVSVLLGVGIAATGHLIGGPHVERASALSSQSASSSEGRNPRGPQDTGRSPDASTTAAGDTNSPTPGNGSTTRPSTTSGKPSPTDEEASVTGTASDDPRARRAARVRELVNQHRADAGCNALRTDDRLVTAAQGHSEDMAERDYLAHTTPEGVTFGQRIRRADHPRPAAENIAEGPRTAEHVVSVWMDSRGHRANILNCSFRSIGVGVTPNGWYWTQNFGY